MKGTNQQIAIDLLELAYDYIKQEKSEFICLALNSYSAQYAVFNKYKDCKSDLNNNTLRHRITTICSILTKYISNCLGKDEYGCDIISYKDWLLEYHEKVYFKKKQKYMKTNLNTRFWAKEGRMQWIKYMIKEIQEGTILQ